MKATSIGLGAASYAALGYAVLGALTVLRDFNLVALLGAVNERAGHFLLALSVYSYIVNAIGYAFSTLIVSRSLVSGTEQSFDKDIVKSFTLTAAISIAAVALFTASYRLTVVDEGVRSDSILLFAVLALPIPFAVVARTLQAALLRRTMLGSIASGCLPIAIQIGMLYILAPRLGVIWCAGIGLAVGHLIGAIATYWALHRHANSRFEGEAPAEDRAAAASSEGFLFLLISAVLTGVFEPIQSWVLIDQNASGIAGQAFATKFAVLVFAFVNAILASLLIASVKEAENSVSILTRRRPLVRLAVLAWLSSMLVAAIYYLISDRYPAIQVFQDQPNQVAFSSSTLLFFCGGIFWFLCVIEVRFLIISNYVAGVAIASGLSLFFFVVLVALFYSLPGIGVTISYVIAHMLTWLVLRAMRRRKSAV